VHGITEQAGEWEQMDSHDGSDRREDVISLLDDVQENDRGNDSYSLNAVDSIEDAFGPFLLLGIDPGRRSLGRSTQQQDGGNEQQ
jgi:hypothetical protein